MLGGLYGELRVRPSARAGRVLRGPSSPHYAIPFVATVEPGVSRTSKKASCWCNVAMSYQLLSLSFSHSLLLTEQIMIYLTVDHRAGSGLSPQHTSRTVGPGRFTWLLGVVDVSVPTVDHEGLDELSWCSLHFPVKFLSLLL